MKGVYLLAFLSLWLPSVQSQSPTPITDPASFVLPFIGTTNGGHVFPGATLPHGMVKVGMDTDSPGNQAGYDANATFKATGFSQLHDTGTGGGISLSNFKIWAFPNCTFGFQGCQTSVESRKVLRNVLPDGSPDDFASPGYFSSNLSNGIRVELTSTRRTAIHRYTFSPGTAEPRMLVDITNDGSQTLTFPVMTLNTTTARVMGGSEFASSFGPQRYTAFTCVDFAGQGFELGSPTEFGTWLGDGTVQGQTDLNQQYFGFVSEMGALFTFNPAPKGKPTVILARAGVSFISSEQACANAEEEIPDFDFDSVQTENRAAWNELLGRVQVDTTNVSTETIQLMYSGLYRSHISPADYTGENPRWNSTEPYYDSYYCNWDTFRTLYSLIALHDPERFALIVRAMIDIQRHEGWLPECRGATNQQFIQGGSNGDPILGEFFVKFSEQAASLNVSADDLYTALLADAELQPPNWNLQGRQANAWKEFNYIPQDMFDAGGANTKQVSRTLEHAFGDFAISQVAKILGKTDDAAKYEQRAGNSFNLWNPNVSVPGTPSVAGMMQPRFKNGTFNFTDPRHCSIHDPLMATCFLNAVDRDGFYEASPIVYSQFVPHDTARSFINRLDFIFEQGYFAIDDEPSFQIPFMYHYANAPGKSTQRTRITVAENFNTSVGGLPGNDASGAMASYTSFALAGLYPVPATRQILLSSPYFPSISFFNPLYNSTTTIKANGFEGNPADGVGGKVFVEGVTVNGKPYKSNCYLDWDVFVNGSLVELTLTTNPNVTCGSGPDALPPSLSTGGFS
ncbi:glycoside hydrolase family 92 protein [Rhodocollybia butyracea]|uniref:Glycoside hydrolase family 92 protein n=1 Tax=Rhodocollybia butyracea TaxID=206335 RepID=A0A9P5PAQ9_9AGAR|nr:glycoside hydrolase family 92 protein [Rhodocollybia butyracea]